MAFVEQLVVLAHLIGFAALLGGVLVQGRAVAPEVNTAMLHGALTLLITGVALVVLQLVIGTAVSWPQVVVKLVITLLLTVLVAANRRFTEIPRGLWALIGAGAIVNAAVAVLWT